MKNETPRWWKRETIDAKLIPATDYCRHHSMLEKQS